MKRRRTAFPAPAPPPGNFLLNLLVDLQLLVAGFLGPRDFRSYCIFILDMNGHAPSSLGYTTKEMDFLRGASKILEKTGLLEGGYWLRGQLLDAGRILTSQSTNTRSNIKSIIGGVNKLLSSEFYEFKEFCRRDLCARCSRQPTAEDAAISSRIDSLLCQHCCMKLAMTSYVGKKLPDGWTPWAWVNTTLARSLLKLPKEENLLTYAAKEEIRTEGTLARPRFLLYDLLGTCKCQNLSKDG
jgi:hypothetical protein